MGTGRLLLVDDNEDNRDILTVLLSQRYSVFSYGSAAEALAALEAIRPHLLVLDIGMRPVDGVQCLKAIHAVRGYSSTPAIAVTGYAREVDKQAFLAAGFQAVISKPILDHAGLETLIDTLLRSADSLAAPSPDTPARHPWWNDPTSGIAS
jgi:CheY-like chemotaxis protein